jgi:vancomycin resistance protein VanW
MTAFRKLARRIAPMPLRLAVARARQNWNDWSEARTFAAHHVEPDSVARLPRVATVEQPIRHTAHFEGKLHNLTQAVARLNGLRVDPASTVSFWRTIGRPSARNGFQTGRAIVDGRLSADIGGGLCQAASLLYELGLRTGMQIDERHAHSRDLYSEDTRFTPLGLDAAIVWGFNDVRWTNAHDHGVVLAFEVRGEALTGGVFGTNAAPAYDLEIARHDEDGKRHVEVRRIHGPSPAVVSRDTYVIDPS